MQSKIAKWAAEDKDRKFDRLLRLIASREWLQEAARITLSLKGAGTPGIDGKRKESILKNLPDFVEQLHTDLLNGSYHPAPARRVYIPKANGKLRPLGIPTLSDRIVQRAMLMAMEPIWECDFHGHSYGFRPERSVHHAIRTVKFQLQDSTYTSGRWVIEGDLSSYFDTVHHKLLMKCVRKRICDARFLALLWMFIKAGHVDKGLFCATSEGVPQGGVISPLLSNIMLNEFDWWLDAKHLSDKARKDRWYWNRTIQDGRPIAERENRKWIPAVAYCRYADDFTLVIKGTKEDAQVIREECREFLEDKLKLTLNLAKTHITHVDDGFVFLGHRIIRKRGPCGTMRTVTTIPLDKAKGFSHKLVEELSGNYGDNMIDLVRSFNYRLAGWANFYQFTDYTAIIYSKVDRIIFWKLAYWLARKYRCSIKTLMAKWSRRPKDANKKAKTWVISGRDSNGRYTTISLRRLVTSWKGQFRYRESGNPYINPHEKKAGIFSRFRDVAMANGHPYVESRMR